ncbi:carboxypeptidase-like regulatory domain-containing protein [Bacteroides ovatus]|nr:carboxypeptidase-like regulatory domain-containing protein [Bacteroides ovatus]MCS3102657.1 carboxypeptidase-like regulatory domain-containing protein [Bacteroides ovatus]
MKKSILSLLLACFLQINLAFAQNVMKGVVSDANGPLVGVVIHDKDNAKGTTSDMSGKYALNGAESVPYNRIPLSWLCDRDCGMGW